MAYVDQQTLEAELVTLEGDTVTTKKPISLTSKSKKGIRYSVKFYPPNETFKIKLKGKTKKEIPFKVSPIKPIKHKTLLVQIIYARNHNTVPKGRASYAVFAIENVGSDEVADFKSFGILGTVERLSRRMGRACKGRVASFSVTFRGSAKAAKGTTVIIVVSVKGRKSGSKSLISIPFLVL